MNKILIGGLVICLIALLVYLFRVQIYKFFRSSKVSKSEQIKKFLGSRINQINSTNQINQINPSNQIDPSNQIEKYSQEISVILCYATWCGHCHTVKEWYQDLIDSSPLSNINFTMVEESNIPPEILDILEGFPTILIICNGSIDKYPGNRNKDDLLNYLKKM
jgi:hypothetical protein